jgi:hypothetical protein
MPELLVWNHPRNHLIYFHVLRVFRGQASSRQKRAGGF